MKKTGITLMLLLCAFAAFGLSAYADVAYTPSIFRGSRGLIFALVAAAVLIAAVILLVIRKNRKKKDEE